MTMLDVSVVIVSYRTPDLVDRCLASLAAHVRVNHEVIVVDNSPGDGTAELVRERHRDVILLENATNVGFAAAVNRGAVRARGRYILLLNPDTEIGYDAVGALMEFADAHPKFGVYGGRTMLPAGTLDPRSCFGAPTMWSSLCWALGLSVAFRKSRIFDPESLGHWKRDTVCPVPVVTGCLLMASRTLWDELGGMDDRYFLFGEDVDFCQRSIIAGAQPVLVPTATIVHHYGASMTSKPERIILLLAGRVTVFRSHWNLISARIGIALLVFGVLVRFVGGRLFEMMTGQVHASRSLAYRAAWRQRRRWMAGYPRAVPMQEFGSSEAHSESTESIMPASDIAPQYALGLRAGDVVEVRSIEEILSTLDENGELDSLPFMPEMQQFCGKQFTVQKVAHKLCDTIGSSGIRRMERAVHLVGARCDGSGHGGCQAGCSMYWKEAWLKRVKSSSVGVLTALAGPLPGQRTIPLLDAATRKSPAPDGTERYSCQATELLRAAPSCLPLRDLGQYVQDVRSGNVEVLPALRSFFVRLFNRLQDFSNATLPRRLRFRGGERWGFVSGRLTGTTPTDSLGLQPGELVRIKSKEEICKTLNKGRLNRGLSFDEEMARFCGREAKVIRLVDRLIDERTGQMLRMKNTCVVLENIWCEGIYHANCPRAIISFWREIWLERVDEVIPDQADRRASQAVSPIKSK